MYRFFRDYEDEPTRGEQLQAMADKYGVTAMELADYLNKQELEEFKMPEKIGGPSSTKNFETFAAMSRNPELLFNQAVGKTLPGNFTNAMSGFGMGQFLQGNI